MSKKRKRGELYSVIQPKQDKTVLAIEPCELTSCDAAQDLCEEGLMGGSKWIYGQSFES